MRKGDMACFIKLFLEITKDYFDANPCNPRNKANKVKAKQKQKQKLQKFK